jgi:hypothetical protein
MLLITTAWARHGHGMLCVNWPLPSDGAVPYPRWLVPESGFALVCCMCSWGQAGSGSGAVFSLAMLVISPSLSSGFPAAVPAGCLLRMLPSLRP